MNARLGAVVVAGVAMLLGARTLCPAQDAAELDRAVRLTRPQAPAPAAPRPPKRFALCIGIDGYQCDGYPPLRFAVADAKELAGTLKTLGYDVTLMTDDAGADLRPTYQNLDRVLLDFCRNAENPDDTLILSFSGHGDKVGGQTGLIPLDYGQKRRIVTLSRLLEYLCDPQCQAQKKMLVLDACRSAAENPQRRLSTGFLQSLGNPESFIVLSGCGENQSSVEDAALGHGRLTSVLLDGLKGQAFLKDQEFLLAEQLNTYVQSCFREHGWQERQSPEMLGRITARVRFDLARRDLPKPPPLSRRDVRLIQLSLADAQAAYLKEDYTDAVECAATILDRFDAKNADALAMRALAYQALGYGKKAREDAAAALAIDANHAVALHVQAMAAHEDHHYEDELHLWRQVGTLTDGGAERWSFLAGGRLAAERHLGIGFGLIALDQNAIDAQREFERVIAERNASVLQLARALTNHGRCLQDRHQVAQAIADYTRVIDMKDAPPWVVTIALCNRAGCFPDDQPRAAIADYTRVLEMKDVPAEKMRFALMERAGCQARAGQWEKAEADCMSIAKIKGLPRDDATAVAYLARALCHSIVRNYEQAVSDCSRALNIHGASVEWTCKALLGRAMFLKELGRVEQAAADYGRLIEMKDAPAVMVAEALLDRGVIFGNTHRDEAALADYTRLIRLKGADHNSVIDAYRNRGICLTRLERYTDAVADLTRVIESKDASAWSVSPSLNQRGVCFVQLNRLDAAIADWTRVIEMKDAPTDQVTTALFNRAVTREKQNHIDQAIADASRVIDLKDATPSLVVRATYLRAHWFEQQGRLELAAADYARMSELKDVTPMQACDGLQYSGDCLVKLGRVDEAIAAYTRMIEYKGAPTWHVAQGLCRRAACRNRLGQIDKAIDDYTRVIQTKDVSWVDYWAAMDYRAMCLYRVGQLDKALADATEVMRKFPRVGLQAGRVALILLRQGNTAEARQNYEQALRLGQKPAEILPDLIELRDKYHGPAETTLFIGWLRLQAGQREQGLADVQAYLKDHPAGACAPWARELLATPTTQTVEKAQTRPAISPPLRP